MKEFIEKLIERLEREKECAKRRNAFDSELSYSFAISIVNQLAEEYKSGWIPCSERLPEEEGYYLITIKFYHLHNPIVMGCNFENGEWGNIDKDDDVVAWMPLPEPYRTE